MQRALELASLGTGCTSPNPLVGCVIVRDNEIIGEGWHALYGHAHAEVNAINDALEKLQIRRPEPKPDNTEQPENTSQPENESATQASNQANTQVTAQGDTQTTTAKPLAGATAYVTLEPCNHHGLTPPCTKAILDAGISHLVYALADPNPKAAGGARHLEEHGLSVVHGVLESQARYQNRFFLKHLAVKKPFVIAKSATSLDGRIATHSGDSQWITGTQSRARAHELRQAVDAIIVGADTVIADDPSLTTRLPESLCHSENVRHPRPVILDSNGRIPLTSHLFSDKSEHTRTLVATTDNMSQSHREQLIARGIELITLNQNPDGLGVDPHELLEALGQRAIQSVLLEGGASVQGSFRDAGLIDEVWTFMAPMLIGGKGAPAAYAANGSDKLTDATVLSDVKFETLGEDVLVRGLVSHKQRS